ncbi:hypothetical protein WR25_11775 [Diploscapter pachys]|uniref:Citrate transporter-like domain-containing protein n=1 Tax=Diploscapter pachys TaxID=2018661 RepID=A0A2A2J970_9BILA|nr:hypothetical protein WR25_11775 [Diploscapter pachys]
MRDSLLDWETIQARFPWSIVLLLGGGFALAAGVKSKLSYEVGNFMMLMKDLPITSIMLICIIITIVLTNICSNTVIASIFVPIVAELARSLHYNPLWLMLPVTLSASFAFLLPVATPPNAICFSAGIIKVKDMVISGFFVSVGCMILNILTMLFWGSYVFKLNEYPLWAYNDMYPVNRTMIDQLLKNSSLPDA